MINLDSKIVKLNGEKVFSARDVMGICGYQKWERFYGAISRALKNTDENLDLHIVHYVKKNTGGRPKEDYWLTFYGLMKVLENADGRKKEVVDVLDCLKTNYTDIKETNDKSNFLLFLKDRFELFKSNIDYIYITLIVLILFTTGVLYFFSNYTNFFIHNPTQTQENQNNNEPQETYVEETIEDKQLREYQEKYIPNENIETNSTQELKEMTIFDKLNEYMSSGDNNFYSKSSYVNIRTDYLFTLSGTDLIDGYFTLGNNGYFRDSCSLLSPNLCLSASKSNLGVFTNFWNKTKSGYENIVVKDSGEFNNEGQKVYCVKYDYKLKDDLSPDYITETFNYSVSNIDGYEQIEQRYCENIKKGTRQLSCPYDLNNYYCENIFD